MHQALILDMDGLIVDTERLYIRCNHDIAHRFNKTLTSQTILRMTGRAPVESLAIFAKDLQIPEEPRKLVALREDMMYQLLQTDLTPMPGLQQFLDYARPIFPLALATGSPARLVNVVIQTLKLNGIFQVIQTSEGLTRGKPHPDIFLRAASRLQITPDHCIVLEDSENGIRAGRAAGCYTIAVPNHDTQSQDFSTAHFVAENLLAAAAHIRNLMP